MTDRDVLERVTQIPYDDFARAHRLLTDSPEDVSHSLTQLAEHFRAKPDDDFVMGPNFLAVLALFSERGRQMAAANMSSSDIRRRQRELAESTPLIAAEFPEITRGDSREEE